MPEEQMHDNEVEAKKAKHYVAFIMDRSSSMRSFGAEAVDAFNQQIETTKKTLEDKDTIEAEVCLVTFSSTVDAPELWCRPLEEVQPWNQEDYQPSGMTAMFDAMGFTIQKLKQQPDIDDPTTSVLIIVITDGNENSSREYQASRIRQLVSEAEATNRWTITYEGANVDLNEVQDQIHVAAGNMLSFNASAQGFSTSTVTRGTAAGAYYSTVDEGVDRFRVSGCAGDLSTKSFYGGTDDGSISRAGSSADTSPDSVVQTTSDGTEGTDDTSEASQD